MLTKGQIISLSENVCNVRIPYFEPVSASSPAIMEAQLVIQPGQFNNYSKGDIVWISFENNRVDLPVVIGKVYSGASEESKNFPGIVQTATLRVNDAAELPAQTTVNGVTLEETFNRIGVLEEAIRVIKNQFNLE